MENFIKVFEEEKFSGLRSTAKQVLAEKLAARLESEARKVSKHVIVEEVVESPDVKKKSLSEEKVVIYQSASDEPDSVKKTGSKKILSFDSLEQARAFLLTSGTVPARREGHVFMNTNRFFHIVPHEDEDRYVDHGVEDNEDHSDQGDSGGGDSGGMSEAVLHVSSKKNAFDQIQSIAKSSGSGVITFEDGDESAMAKASAKEIVKYMDKQPPLERAKLIAQLTKNLTSFMTTLNTIIKD